MIFTRAVIVTCFILLYDKKFVEVDSSSRVLLRNKKLSGADSSSGGLRQNKKLEEVDSNSGGLQQNKKLSGADSSSGGLRQNKKLEEVDSNSGGLRQNKKLSGADSSSGGLRQNKKLEEVDSNSGGLRQNKKLSGTDSSSGGLRQNKKLAGADSSSEGFRQRKKIAEADPSSEVIDGLHQFVKKILWTHNEMFPGENVVFSPLSVGILLNLIMMGSYGDTYYDIREAFNYSASLEDDEINAAYQKVLKSLEQTENGVYINLKSKLFLQYSFTLFDWFKNVSETSYIAEVETLDFQSSPNKTKTKINSWASDNTNGYVNEIIKGELNNDSKLVATNVMLFLAPWKNSFDYLLTQNGEFCTEKENITLPMMSSSMHVPYLVDYESKVEMISLPYKGDRYNLLILQPLSNCRQAVRSLKRIQMDLNGHKLKLLIKKMAQRNVSVNIPRMRLNSDFYLPTYLYPIGIKRIFSHEADFRWLTNENGLFISEIIHRAYLQITEEGTMAAEGSVGIGIKFPHEVRFELNKPSLLFVRDNDNDLNLFYTKLLKPDPMEY